MEGDSYVTLGGQSIDVIFTPGFLADNAVDYGSVDMVIRGDSFFGQAMVAGSTLTPPPV